MGVRHKSLFQRPSLLLIALSLVGGVALAQENNEGDDLQEIEVIRLYEYGKEKPSQNSAEKSSERNPAAQPPPPNNKVSVPKEDASELNSDEGGGDELGEGTFIKVQ